MSNVTPKGTRPAPGAVQNGVREVLERDGERAACERFGLSRLAVTKLATGRPVLPGTTALAASRLGIDLASAVDEDGDAA